jgi:two-component system sensor histidine kinase/response regulator
LAEHLIYITGVTMVAFGLFLVADRTIASRQHANRFQRWLLYSLVFGLMAVACIRYAQEVRPGVIIDARGAILVVATLTGGYGVGVATTAAALLSRWLMGGAGMNAGLAGLLCDFLFAAAVCWLWRRWHTTWAKSAALLAVAGFGVGGIEAWSLTWIGSSEQGWALFRASGLDLWVTQLVCTLLMGSLIHLERERGQAQDAARANASRLQALMDNLDTHIYVKAEDGRYLFANHHVVAQFGRPLENIIGRTDDEILPAETARQIAAFDEAVRRSGSRQSRVESVASPDGNVRQFWSTKLLIPYEGHPRALMGLSTDITEIKRLEASLRRAKEFAEQLMETANVIMLGLDREGRVVLFNAKGEEITGYSRQELMGRGWFDLVLSRDPSAQTTGALRQAMATGEMPRQLEYTLWTHAGEPREISWWTSLIANPDGAPLSLSLGVDVTEQRQADQELAAYRQDLERRVAERTAEALDLYNNAPCGYHALDAEGRVLEMNDTELRWLGRSREEVVGRLRLSDLMTLQDADRFSHEYARFVESGSTTTEEWEWQRKDGSTLSVLVRTTAVRDAQGRFVERHSTVLDITDRKRLEETLRASEEKFRVLFETSRDAIITTDVAGRCLDCNSAALEMFGFVDKAALMAWGIANLMPAWQPDGRDSRVVFVEGLRKALTEGNCFIEWEQQHADGSIFPAEVSISVAEIHGRKVLHSLVRDISQRKRSESELRASEARFRRLIEMAPLPLVLVSPDDRFILINARFSRVLGYTVADVPTLQLWWEKAYPDAEYRCEVQARWAEAIARARAGSGTVAAREYQVTCKDGVVRSMLVSGSIIEDGFLAALWDVTVEKRAAEELRVAKEAAESANRAKSTFLANMSHEIRTPMNAVLGFAQLMLRDPNLPPQHRQQITTISRSGEHLMAIINDILEMARIESGRVTLNPVLFDLHQLLEDLANMFELRARAKDLRFRVERLGEVPRYVLADETKLRQVLINLLGNAVKFAPQGGAIDVRLRSCGGHPTEPNASSSAGLHKRSIAVAQCAQPQAPSDALPTGSAGIPAGTGIGPRTTPAGEEAVAAGVVAPEPLEAGPAADALQGGKLRLEIEVEDTGPGISPEDQAHLFESFFQTATGRETSGGTGLGLAISRQFVRLMGGDMTVRSQHGVGSKFCFDILVAIAAADSLGTAAAASRQVRHLAPGSTGRRILIVDDQPVNRDLLQDMLAPIGFQLRTAAQGAEAVELCRRWLPQLVLMDLRMPAMDGQEAIRQIRVDHGSAVKIIALSASVFAKDRQDSLACGADAFMAKPFHETDLFEQIRQLTGVEYIYLDPQGEVDEARLAPGAEATVPVDIQGLPESTLASLRDALSAADYDRMLQITDQIVVWDAVVGQRLRRMVERFEYETLQTLLEQRS